ncbi:uracil-DNA glycosylase [Paenibacillus rigui]|uniref:Uracil-DNA glycosylase n=1 Tax=Paenibacillus rigui TaxID=554312 RepID=A0A229UI09_9BACL|nr:uracil-DNA glycosylase [Paenibacillus rigui]OXM82935.1 uracil-DNA glycosylase [Paenibacillus rigui]
MTAFKPEILREEAPPAFAAQCQGCELARQRHRVVWGEGNQQAPIFILMDNPGAREDKEGHPFVCGTRETLQLGMKEAGLELSQVYVSYLLKCRPVRAYDKPLAREACFSHLRFQLEEKKPCILLGLGNIVVQTLYPEQEADVKGYRGRWHAYEGIPSVFSYHPLAVRRRPVLMKYFVQDLKLVAERNKAGLC